MSSINTRNANLQKRYDFGGLTNTLPGDWSLIRQDAGTSMGVASGILTLNSGTTAGSEIHVRCTKGIKLKALARAILQLSQRIANQSIFFELVNAAGTTFARWTFDGTSATNAKCASGNLGVSTGDVTVGINTTVNYTVFEIYGELEQILFSNVPANTNSAKSLSAVFDRNIPEPDEEYFVQFRIVNGGTAPVSSTALNIDAVFIEDLETVAVEMLRGPGDSSAATAIAVRGTGGSLDQVTQAFISPRTSRQTETTTNLAAAAVFTGTSRDMGSTHLFDKGRVLVIASHDGTLEIQESNDGTTWFTSEANVPVTANTPLKREWNTVCRFQRVRYTNGATATTSLRIESIFMGTG